MRTRVIVQIVAIAVGAVLTFVVGWKYSDAASAWQEGIRAEVARAGVDQDDVRRVYANEGPNAYRVAATEIRADALAALATTDATADTQREIATQSAFALRSAAQPGTLLGERQYDLEGGGSDLARRLGDVRAAHAPPADPDDADREGDGLARLASVTAIVTAVVTGLSAVGACVRRRRSATKESLQFVPQPALATAAQKRASYILLIIWVAGVLIPLVQLVYSSEEQRYQADAARHSVQARSDESISRTRTEFIDNALQTAREGSVAATAREIAAVYQSADVSAAASRLARAEEAAADRSAGVAQKMARVPPDAALARALTTRQYDWDYLNARSTWETRRADSASLISNILLALIAVVALIGPAMEYRLKGREAAAEAALAETSPTQTQPPDAKVPAVVTLAPAAGHQFLAGLVTGSAFGMSAVWWLGRRRRRS